MVRRHAAYLLSSACLIAFAQSVSAQSVEPAAEDVAASTSPAEEPGIVVTGSRIIRRDFTAESPITTVDEKFLEDSGPVTLEQSLNALPQFQPSTGAQTSTIGAAGAGTSGGQATANLRGLGPERTLVLFDGRRLQPSNTSGAIDLNTITPALISTVEVITGGASAVYGSDAIAGVVNFRFNNRFRGIELQADAGITELGDGATYSLAATYGGAFADGRARVWAAGSYHKREAASTDEREFFDNEIGTSSPTSGLLIQSGTNPFGFGSAANVAAYRNLFTRTYGTALPSTSSSFNVNFDRTIIGRTGGLNFRPDPRSGLIVADGAIRQVSLYDSTVQLPLERYTGFGRAEFDVTDGITAYGQINYATYQTDQLSGSGVLQSVVEPVLIPATNPFVTGDIRILFNARPRPNDPVALYFTGTRIGRVRVVQDYDIRQFLGGFKGSLGSDLNFDVYVSHGRTNQDASAYNQISRSRFNQLINAADGGNSLCAGGYDPFGYGPVSQACTDFLTFTATNRFRFKQTVVQGNLTGSLFTLPGGDAGFAVGAEYRKNSFAADIDPRNSPTPTNTPGVFTAPEAFGTSGQLSSGGSIEAREVYGELLLPVLADVPFFLSLELNLAYRYSDYDTIGGVHTYKASANWEPFDGLSFRGGYSRAIRAPSLGDLYSPKEGATGIIGRATLGGGDPCDINGAARKGQVEGVDPAKVRALCIANGVPVNLVDGYSYSGSANAAYRVGNPNLQEETADSYTIGAVIKPAFLQGGVLRRFQASVDYYDIRVEDAIGYVTSPIALNQCFNFGGLNPNYDPANQYCALIKRDQSGILASIDEPLFNLAKYQTTGLDFQVDAAIGVGRLGTLSLNSALTRVIDYKIQSIAAEPTYDYAGTIGNTQIDGFSSTHPKFKHVTTAALGGDMGSLSLRWRYIGKQADSATISNPDSTAVGVPAVSYFDLIGRVLVNDEFELRAGVTNLTDKQPPVYGGPSSTALSAYDVIGRRFFIGATARF